MKHLMKHIVMVVVVAALVVGGYMAYKHFYGSEVNNVKVQFLDFGGDHSNDEGWTHTSQYKKGYDAGYSDCKKGN